MAKIYLASSWRNPMQPYLLKILRAEGHEVYDFRNPTPGKKGFSWNDISSNWLSWTASEYIENLRHSNIVKEAFALDYNAMWLSQIGVLLLPCGRSAHLELGWMAGRGKYTFILTKDGEEPELMAKMCTAVCCDIDELLDKIRKCNV